MLASIHRKLWRTMARTLAGKILTTFYRRLIFEVRSLDEPIPHLKSSLPVRVSFLTEENLDPYRCFRPDQDMEEIRARLARGHRCCVSWHEGRIVDASWVATGRVHIPYLRRDLILTPGDLYVYDGFTLPAYRGHGLFMAKVAYIFRRSKDEGYSRNVAVFAIENERSIAVTQRLGAKPIGMYSCLRIGPWQRTWQNTWSKESLPPLV